MVAVRLSRWMDQFGETRPPRGYRTVTERSLRLVESAWNAVPRLLADRADLGPVYAGHRARVARYGMGTSAACAEAILAAVTDLFGQADYDAMTVDAVPLDLRRQDHHLPPLAGQGRDAAHRGRRQRRGASAHRIRDWQPAGRAQPSQLRVPGHEAFHRLTRTRPRDRRPVCCAVGMCLRPGSRHCG
jgi:hypothetical protein